MYVLELAGTDDALAAREAASVCSAVEVIAPGLATASDIDRVADLAFTRRASELVGRCEPSVAAARGRLAESLDRAGPADDETGPADDETGPADDETGPADDETGPADDETGPADERTGPVDDGTGPADDPAGTVAVRARDVRGLTGVATQVVERDLGAVLVDRGWTVDLEDPDHELRAVFSEGTCALGWFAVQGRRGFGNRRPTDKPFFQPGSMDPPLARALVNIAGAGSGARLVDPMCGTGGILVEAGLVGSTVLGVDAQWKMVRGARENLAHYLDAGASVCRGDATRLALRDNVAECVVFDAPYGRQSKVAGRSLAALVGDALAEACRITSGRCVVVGDRPWTDAARAAGWTVESTFERRVHRSLARHILVLE